MGGGGGASLSTNGPDALFDGSPPAACFFFFGLTFLIGLFPQGFERSTLSSSLYLFHLSFPGMVIPTAFFLPPPLEAWLGCWGHPLVDAPPLDLVVGVLVVASIVKASFPHEPHGLIKFPGILILQLLSYFIIPMPSQVTCGSKTAISCHNPHVLLVLGVEAHQDVRGLCQDEILVCKPLFVLP